MEQDKTKQHITELVDNWASETFGNGFTFRKNQKEACVNIIHSFLNKEKNYILEAPTGSGKSIIAMIVGGVLSSYYGLKGYILISDLSLIQQYERDVDKYLPDWGVIKGQDNYTCVSNSMSFKLGDCQIHGKKRSYDEIMNEYSECAPTCQYLLARQKASESDVTVCTYHHWLTYQNPTGQNPFAKSNMENCGPFPRRDFIICDEAHKLVDIIQSMYSIHLTNVERNNIDTIRAASDTIFKELRNKIQNLFDELIEHRDDAVNVLEDLKNLRNALTDYNDKAASVIRHNVDYGLEGGKLYKFARAYAWLGDYAETINLFVEAIKRSLDNLVVTYVENPESLTFNCLDEEYLMNKYFYPHFDSCLYMSATIGDFSLYAKNCHMRKYSSEVIPSTFDFSKSPIFYCDTYKMNYANKDTNIPYIAKMINSIMDMFPTFRGCVLVSSYDMADKIIQGVSPQNAERILMYKDSKDKREVLDRYRYQDGTVIIGPSLFDGLSFDDDLCRFLVIAKVPYPDMKNNFVKKKMERNYDWYAGQASLSIIQGVGRGVRSETDWCYSFILDGCFSALARNSGGMYSPQFRNRVIMIDENLQLKQ